MKKHIVMQFNFQFSIINWKMKIEIWTFEIVLTNHLPSRWYGLIENHIATSLIYEKRALIYFNHTAWKVYKYRVFSGPYFPAFGLNMERHFVSLCIQSECGKIRTRKNSVFGHFSHSVSCSHSTIFHPAADTVSLKTNITNRWLEDTKFGIY